MKNPAPRFSHLLFVCSVSAKQSVMWTNHSKCKRTSVKFGNIKSIQALFLVQSSLVMVASSR